MISFVVMYHSGFRQQIHFFLIHQHIPLIDRMAWNAFEYCNSLETVWEWPSTEKHIFRSLKWKSQCRH